jgi:hypothetical protein
MLEHNLRELLGDLDGRVHEAKRGGKDQLVSAAGELPDHAFGVRSFGDILDEAGLDLVAELLLDRLAAQIVAMGPAVT